ncbi:MAG: DUF2268 domain-containing protein [Candidatus Marinimicrobia bacterium]|nr:DUF2268 domain-containing protein [Candidatus Neomarinimicrobiota bacterium]MCF7829038.1 DUF2268 domain-containing protein [Candidatus Neomarinimicrobiota bacterium]MCF7881825.1 DUF2268 domain-containing protein [Candidatus Neomarinimicrobiota bacterium]
MISLACPNCEEPLEEESLEKSLICPHCSINMKQPKFQDFLEYLMMQGIVEEVDFFDLQLYGDEIMSPFQSEFDDADTSPYEKGSTPYTPYRDNMDNMAEGEDTEQDEDEDW